MLAASLLKCSNSVFFLLSTGSYYCFSFTACARYKKGGSQKNYVLPRLQFLPLDRTFFRSFSYPQNAVDPAYRAGTFGPIKGSI